MFKKNDWIFGLISILIGVFVLVNIRDLLKVSNSMDPAGPAALPSNFALLIAAIMLSVGLRYVKKIAITSIVTTLILFVSFSFGLNVDLPLGILKRFF